MALIAIEPWRAVAQHQVPLSTSPWAAIWGKWLKCVAHLTNHVEQVALIGDLLWWVAMQQGRWVGGWVRG